VHSACPTCRELPMAMPRDRSICVCEPIAYRQVRMKWPRQGPGISRNLFHSNARHVTIMTHVLTHLVPCRHHDSCQVLTSVASNGQHDDGQEALGDAGGSAGPLNGARQVPARPWDPCRVQCEGLGATGCTSSSLLLNVLVHTHSVQLKYKQVHMDDFLPTADTGWSHIPHIS
jgi:hypothetical protein